MNSGSQLSELLPVSQMSLVPRIVFRHMGQKSWGMVLHVQCRVILLMLLFSYLSSHSKGGEIRNSETSSWDVTKIVFVDSRLP